MVHYTFQHIYTITELSPVVITILHEYHITNMRKCGNTSRCTRVKQHKGTHEFKKENSRDSQGAWKDEALDDLRGSTLPLRYSEHTLLAPWPGHENPGESVKLPRRAVIWMPGGEPGWAQVSSTEDRRVRTQWSIYERVWHNHHKIGNAR